MTSESKTEIERRVAAMFSRSNSPPRRKVTATLVDDENSDKKPSADKSQGDDLRAKMASGPLGLIPRLRAINVMTSAQIQAYKVMSADAMAKAAIVFEAEQMELKAHHQTEVAKTRSIVKADLLEVLAEQLLRTDATMAETIDALSDRASERIAKIQADETAPDSLKALRLEQVETGLLAAQAWINEFDHNFTWE